MHTVGAFEAKNTLGALLDRVEAGEEILITRHGKPASHLTPISKFPAQIESAPVRHWQE
jgi:prevent-host-death family protein